MEDIFNKIASITKPAKKAQIEDVLLPLGYACETLINGNISHCIEYLNDVLSIGVIQPVISEMELIKEQCPERYKYVYDRLRIKI